MKNNPFLEFLFKILTKSFNLFNVDSSVPSNASIIPSVPISYEGNIVLKPLSGKINFVKNY